MDNQDYNYDEWDNYEYSWKDEDDNASDSQVKDANGNPLENGDSVCPIKDLPIKGMPKGLKRGDKIKNIRLTDNPEEIECKIGKTVIVLKTCYFKKI